MASWEPRETSSEDRLLATYHGRVGGRIYTEVAAPWGGGYKDWPDGWENRYIDAIRIKDPFYDEKIVPFANHGTEVLRAVDDASIELIEVKSSLGRGVIGQIVAGIELFKADYTPDNVEGLALCERTDSALEWACEQQNIGVEILEPDESVWRYNEDVGGEPP